MTVGQVSDYKDTAARLDDLPKAQWLLGDRDYDADWFRGALEAKGVQLCIQVGDIATNRSDMTSAGAGAAAASSACSAV